MAEYGTGFGKQMLMIILSIILIWAFFGIAMRKPSLVPSRVQWIAESGYAFVRNGIGRDILGEKHFRQWVPLLFATFFFVLFTNLFVSRGVEEAEAWHLADAIEDWRDEDDLPRLYGAELAEYEAAGYPYGPANQPFGSVDELQQVIGMSWDLFRELEPLLTVHSSGQINPAFASADAIYATMPDISLEEAQQFVHERHYFHPAYQ